MDINNVLQAHGVLGGGGSGGVKKIYSLVMQAEEPQNPKAGDLWVNPIKEVSKVTIALNKPDAPVDGELLIQVDHVVYEMDFKKLSAKVEGNQDNNVYVFNINALTNESINNNFIPLFQKDVVKEYAILNNIYQYDSTAQSWLIPESYFYNGTAWIKVDYKIHLQYIYGLGGSSTHGNGYYEKRNSETLDIAETPTLPTYVFQVNNDGSYFAKAIINSNSLQVTKYDLGGNIISSLTFTQKVVGAITYPFPRDINYVDDFGNYYVLYATASSANFGGGSRYLLKFSSSGEFIFAVDLSGSYTFNAYLGRHKNYLFYKQYDGTNSAMPIIILDMNTGSYHKTYSYRYMPYYPVFEEDYFIVFIPVSPPSGQFHLFRYDGTLLSSTTVQNMSSVVDLYAGSNTSGTTRIYLYKDKMQENTFIFISSTPAGSNNASINKFTVDLSQTSTNAVSIYKVIIPYPIGYSNPYHNLQAREDQKGNIYTVWYKTLNKYDKDTGQVIRNVTLEEQVQNSNISSYPVPDGTFFEYARG